MASARSFFQISLRRSPKRGSEKISVVLRGWPPLYVGEHLVGYRLRTLANAHPITAHAAWRTSPDLARDVVLETVRRARIPEPMQLARQLAKQFRAESAVDQGRSGRRT